MLMVCCARVILAVVELLIVLRRVYSEWCVKFGARRRRSRVVQCTVLHASRKALKGSLPVRARLATFTSASRTDRRLTHFTPLYASLHVVRSTFFHSDPNRDVKIQLSAKPEARPYTPHWLSLEHHHITFSKQHNVYIRRSQQDLAR